MSVSDLARHVNDHFLANRLWNGNLTQGNVQCKGIMGLAEAMVKEAGGRRLPLDVTSASPEILPICQQ